METALLSEEIFEVFLEWQYGHSTTGFGGGAGGALRFLSYSIARCMSSSNVLSKASWSNSGASWMYFSAIRFLSRDHFCLESGSFSVLIVKFLYETMSSSEIKITAIPHLLHLSSSECKFPHLLHTEIVSYIVFFGSSFRPHDGQISVVE